jgi:hypothetical protein
MTQVKEKISLIRNIIYSTDEISHSPIICGVVIVVVVVSVIVVLISEF